MVELTVVAAHGAAWIDQCRDSLRGANLLVIDTGSGAVPAADVTLEGGYPTGAYRWAYEHVTADRYLFVQDSMTALGDPLPWFREQLPAEGGAVAWALFPQQWDNPQQQEWVESRYPGTTSPHGIFGPVFYTDRASLDVLADRDLFPPVPADRWQAQATERAWAYAFAAAGLPLVGPEWGPDAMRVAWGPFRKVWAARP